MVSCRIAATSVSTSSPSSASTTATATADLPDFAAITPETGGRNLDVRIELVDSEGTLVQDATITCWITAKKKR